LNVVRSKLFVALVIVSAFTACGGGDDSAGNGGSPPVPSASADTEGTKAASQPADAAAVIDVRVMSGEVTGVDDIVDVAVGDDVRLEVTADVDDEVHVHGYDRVDAVAPGNNAVLRFTADIPGVFEVELESAGTVLFELRVR
jgi:hypothetical protein